jgi:predicted metal-dependent phosphoesterase TrpH
MHSTASDGAYTPAQLIDLAKRSGLAAISITDHDTVAGYLEAKDQPTHDVTVVPGVEISTEDQGRELHLLGYFFDHANEQLRSTFEQLCVGRAERFREMIERLRTCGVNLEDVNVPIDATSLGRRHLAEMMLKAGHVSSIREAFNRYLGHNGPAFAPKVRVQLADAIRIVRDARGITSLAHPSQDLDLLGLRRLADMGLQAMEAVYPGFTRSRIEELRQWAKQLNLAITGGSDCHGPDARAVGSCTLSSEEWLSLSEAR